MKDKKTFWLVILPTILIVIVGMGLIFWAFSEYQAKLDEQKEANNLIKVLNKNTNEINQVFLAISENNQAVLTYLKKQENNSNEIQNAVAKLESSSSNLQTLSKSTQDSISKIKAKTDNPDLEKVAKKTKSNLQTRSDNIESLADVLNARICYYQLRLINDKDAQKLAQNDEILRQDQNNLEAHLSNAELYLKIGNDLGEYQNCYLGELQKYNSEELQQKITQDERYFLNLAKRHELVAEFLETDQTEKLTQAQEVEKEIGDYVPQLFLSNNFEQAFNADLDKIIQDVITKTEKQDEEFQKQIKETFEDDWFWKLI